MKNGGFIHGVYSGGYSNITFMHSCALDMDSYHPPDQRQLLHLLMNAFNYGSSGCTCTASYTQTPPKTFNSGGRGKIRGNNSLRLPRTDILSHSIDSRVMLMAVNTCTGQVDRDCG